MDRFCTPEHLAVQMVNWVAPGKRSTIADFAAGDGRLLKAAQLRWPHANIIATDISQQIIKRLQRYESKWAVGRCDFLSERSRLKCRCLKNAIGTVSLALLNPPFSYRGGAKWNIESRGMTYQCSKALAFVATAIGYLSRDGMVIALLPQGCLKSQKDAALWESIRESHTVDVLSTNGYKTFTGCFPKTAIVGISKRIGGARPTEIQLNGRHFTGSPVTVIRGSVQMHKVSSIGRMLPLIHTTELKNGKIDVHCRKVSAGRRSVSGPAVLLPRVGAPNRSKVKVYSSSQPIVLSDCVFAIMCKTNGHAIAVQRRIVKKWSVVEERYGGTCARYITLASLTEALSQLGIRVAIP